MSAEPLPMPTDTSAGTALPRPRPGIMGVAPYVPGESEAEGATEPARLAANESAIGASPRAIAAYEAAGRSLHRYPDGGATPLRAAIARRYGLDPARIICGNGSDELIALITRAYAGEGDEVLYSRHGFLMYPIAAQAAGASPVTAAEVNLRTDVGALLAAVTPRTRIVFVANPNNPTGSYITTEELRRLQRGLRPDILLVIDAAYAEYVTRNDYGSGEALVDAAQNVVMTRTFSKIHGLAALRLGWAYGSAAVIDVLNRVRPPFNVSAVAQAAGIAAIEDTAHVARARTQVEEMRPRLREQLMALGLDCPESVANFQLVRFPAVGGRSPAEVAAAVHGILTSRGVLVRRMGGYGLPEALRITIGLEPQMRACVEGIAAALDELAGRAAEGRGV